MYVCIYQVGGLQERVRYMYMYMHAKYLPNSSRFFTVTQKDRKICLRTKHLISRVVACNLFPATVKISSYEETLETWEKLIFSASNDVQFLKITYSSILLCLYVPKIKRTLKKCLIEKFRRKRTALRSSCAGNEFFPVCFAWARKKTIQHIM